MNQFLSDLNTSSKPVDLFPSTTMSKPSFSCCLFSSLIWINILSSADATFKWCYFFSGECLPQCQGNSEPFGTYGNIQIQQLLCRGSGWCCPKPFWGSRANSAPSTTTTTTIRTTTPTTTTTTVRPEPICGIPGVRSKIIGGLEADYCEFQYMVHVARDGSPCGGTIIDGRHILTAAHCVWDLNGLQPVITIGEYNRSSYDPAFEFNTTDYDIHLYSRYNDKTYEHDIAILRLKTPIDFSRYRCMRPICLPTETFRDVTCTVTGWGVTEPNFDIFNPPLSNVLLKVQIPIVNDSVCERIYQEEYYTKTNICAGDLSGGKDSCGGDSGGPLICRRNGREYVAGIVSAGSGCAQRDKAAIYTDVSAYRTWIDSIINS